MTTDDDKTRFLPDTAKTNTGTQLSGIYELDERIASGGMGEVYRGHNIQTGDHVAIKIVLPEFARDQTILSLFKKEASILNHLSHDAIVRYHVFTIDPGIGRPYLAMEFVNGESLFDVMRRGAMPTEDVRKLCHRLASGLSAVHEAGAVHRDLSPDNVILPGGRVERAKIIDFGIARSATVGGETLIGGRFAGKYNYVSPEQLGLYGGEVSGRSDIYSLGLVLAAVLRGKPIEMNGSQYEIVEKRRTVPDLSGIDDSFRPIIEAMLQPNPLDRPTSAEIARATRDDTPVANEGTMAPGVLRDQPTAWPQTRQGVSVSPRDAAPVDHQDLPSPIPPPAPAAKATDEPRFVPHVRPAHLSQPRPAPPAPSPAPAPPRRSRRTGIAASAALAVLIAGTGAGVYFGGFMTTTGPSVSPEGETSRLTPGTTQPSDGNQSQGSPPAETQTEASSPAAPQADTSATVQPPATTADSQLPAGDNAPAGAPKDEGEETAQTSADAAATAQPQAESSAAAAQQQGGVANAQPADKTVEAQPPTKPAESQAEKARPESQAENQTADQPPGAEPPKDQTQTGEAAGQPDSATGPAQQTGQQAGGDKSEDTVAMNLSKPEVPATGIGDVAERISWLRDYGGGDCFYATATSATDKAIDIEGFGTAVEPFTQMLDAFQAKFHIEPDVSVRLIEPAQCGVTDFLRALGATSAERPKLALDRTSVPSGSPISGTLKTLSGLRSNLLLIDHKGMVFNLNERVTVQAGQAAFTIPIGLGAADQAARKVVPQIILVITGDADIQAAEFSSPTPASVVLPKILAEIEKKQTAFSATAKYFQLGG